MMKVSGTVWVQSLEKKNKFFSIILSDSPLPGDKEYQKFMNSSVL